jgi:hypothetical protein
MASWYGDAFSSAAYVGDWRLWLFLAALSALILAVVSLVWVRPIKRRRCRGGNFSGGFIPYADGNAGVSVQVGTGLGPNDAFHPIVLGFGAFVAATSADFDETLSSLAWAACETGAVFNLNVVLTDALARGTPQPVTATLYYSPACAGSFVATPVTATVEVGSTDPASYCLSNTTDEVIVGPGDRIALLLSAGTTGDNVVFLNVNAGLRYDFAPFSH